MCVFHFPFVLALAALGATALLGACGKNGGACMDCDEDQSRARIEYMLGAKLE